MQKRFKLLKKEHATAQNNERDTANLYSSRTMSFIKKIEKEKIDKLTNK